MAFVVDALQQPITQRRSDASEATLAILERQLTQVEPLNKDEISFVIGQSVAIPQSRDRPLPAKAG